MAGLLNRLEGLIQRVVKLEKLTKYMLAMCCESSAALPQVDFIVDLFDRADASDMGRYWGGSAAFQLRDGSAISQKGSPVTREETLPYLDGSAYISSVYNSGASNDNQSYIDWHCTRLSRLVDGLVLSDEVFSELTLASYAAALSNVDHVVEIGFTILAQETEGNPPNTVPSEDPEDGCFGTLTDWDYDACYSSVASQIRPVARFTRDTGIGVTAKADFGDTKEISFATAPTVSLEYPTYLNVQPTYTDYMPSFSLSFSAEDTYEEPNYVGHNVQFATFGEAASPGVYTLNELPSWLTMNGFRFVMKPHEERGFVDVDPGDCWNDPYRERTVSESDVACRMLTRTYSAGGSVCWTSTGACATQYPSCTAVSNYEAAIPYTMSGWLHIDVNRLPPHEASPAIVGFNVLRMEIVGTQVQISVNGVVVSSFTQDSVVSGSQVGMFSAGDVISWAANAGLSAYPRIAYFKAWVYGTPEPVLDESGHGHYGEEGEKIWSDGYHTKTRDESGEWDGGWSYNPLALDS